jgi:hypothetical protein
VIGTAACADDEAHSRASSKGLALETGFSKREYHREVGQSPGDHRAGFFLYGAFLPFQPAAEKFPVNFLLFTGSLIFTLAMVALPARNLSVVMPRFMRGIQ